MRTNTKIATTLGFLAAISLGFQSGLQAQTTATPPYVPGVTYQTANPAYPTRNPFYFEGKVDWDLLKITTPSNAWEFAQRGIHYQDDLEDTSSAMADYKTSISMNDLGNGSCQLITSATVANQGANLNPPPCMFTVRLRLANLERTTDPASAITLFQEVLRIDPVRLGVNELIGESYESLADSTSDPTAKTAALQKAVTAFKAELALSPVTALATQLTGDEANNAHVHWSLSEVYTELGDSTDSAAELALYLKATKWHSDTYPWHINLANKRLGN